MAQLSFSITDVLALLTHWQLERSLRAAGGENGVGSGSSLLGERLPAFASSSGDSHGEFAETAFDLPQLGLQHCQLDWHGALRCRP